MGLIVVIFSSCPTLLWIPLFTWSTPLRRRMLHGLNNSCLVRWLDWQSMTKHMMKVTTEQSCFFPHYTGHGRSCGPSSRYVNWPCLYRCEIGQGAKHWLDGFLHTWTLHWRRFEDWLIHWKVWWINLSHPPMQTDQMRSGHNGRPCGMPFHVGLCG